MQDAFRTVASRTLLARLEPPWPLTAGLGLRPSRSAPRAWHGGPRGGSTRRGRSGRPRPARGAGRAAAVSVGSGPLAGPDVGAVGGLQVLDPPALAVGGQLRLAPAHADVARAVDVGVDAAAAPRGGRPGRCCADSGTTAGSPGEGHGSSLSCAAYQSGSTHTSATHSTGTAGPPGRRLGPPRPRGVRGDRRPVRPAPVDGRCRGVGVGPDRGPRSSALGAPSPSGARHRAGGEVVAAGLAEQRPGGVVGRAVRAGHGARGRRRR